MDGLDEDVAAIDVDVLGHHYTCSLGRLASEGGIGQSAAARHQEVEDALFNRDVAGGHDALAVELLVVEIQGIG